ncbi:hypothetical protein Y032_0152g2866 [Ancylostoma ceylanicum]|uniref:Gustatory receptor n=1 Tax=Ancylostoma ceylanicum TaxID=53326 RepID=A0A016T0F9_9BILA|nr:hypothetical protein Y032_0152g2866 [Ancylostoma ceylanicum]
MPVLEISEGKISDYKETKVSLEPKAELEEFMQKILHVVSIMRLNFIEPSHWSTSKVVNAVVTTFMFGLACYSLFYMMHITFTVAPSATMMSSKLLQIAWALQSIVSLVFLVYWQVSGRMRSLQQNIGECQHGAGIGRGRNLMMRNITKFYMIIYVEIFVVILYSVISHFDDAQSDFAKRWVQIFYFPQLRFMIILITLYTYIAWNASMFIYIIYTNAAFLEVKYFNNELEKLDGATNDVEEQLLRKMEAYRRLCDVIRELDRLYAFIMLVIIIPSVIITLMMLNQRIHGLKDILLCTPSIALCAYSFLGVTVAPARLHDEVGRSRISLIRNESIWFPYRKDVFVIAQVLSTHMEQTDLGISIWGFAILSRPLVLATFSVMAMLLSMIIELTPAPLG